MYRSRCAWLSLVNCVVERKRQQEAEQHLDPDRRHPELLEQLHDVPVLALLFSFAPSGIVAGLCVGTLFKWARGFDSPHLPRRASRLIVVGACGPPKAGTDDP
jgi:hypothetical protein